MTDPIIQIRGLAYRWPGQSAFELVVPEFEVARGSRVMLLGPSGSGKSTLLSLICGVLKPDAGTLRVLDAKFETMSGRARDRFRAEHIGVIFQQFNLLPYGSILDNIALPLSFARDRRNRAVGAGGLETEANRLLAALDLQGIPTSRRASDLSIGQQQRVAVARALIGAPELVVADEPTSALDEETQTRFLDLMIGQLEKTGATLIMVTHDQRLAPHFDQVVHLGDLMQRHALEAAQ
jgi:putative ABC transport system ATP-binding protein